MIFFCVVSVVPLGEVLAKSLPARDRLHPPIILDSDRISVKPTFLLRTDRMRGAIEARTIVATVRIAHSYHRKDRRQKSHQP